jgi:hypothetical protein
MEILHPFQKVCDFVQPKKAEPPSQESHQEWQIAENRHNRVGKIERGMSGGKGVDVTIDNVSGGSRFGLWLFHTAPFKTGSLKNAATLSRLSAS